MKRLFLFLSVGLIFGFVFFASCGGGENGEELTPQQERAQILQGTWTVQSATVPQGVDPTILNGGTMTFSTDQNHNPAAFASSGMPDFFSVGGSASWTFSGAGIDIIALTNVTPVADFTINNLTSSSLSINFSHPGLAGGRISDLSGPYTAQLSK